MICHLASFAYLTLFIIVCSSLDFAIGSQALEDTTLSEKRLIYARTILDMFEGVGAVGVIVTMMIMFLKHSMPLTSTE